MTLYNWLRKHYPHIADEWDYYYPTPYSVGSSWSYSQNTEKMNNEYIICSYCETKNKDDKEFCISCGAPLDCDISNKRNKPGWCL